MSEEIVPEVNNNPRCRRDVKETLKEVVEEWSKPLMAVESEEAPSGELPKVAEGAPRLRRTDGKAVNGRLQKRSGGNRS